MLIEQSSSILSGSACANCVLGRKWVDRHAQRTARCQVHWHEAARGSSRSKLKHWSARSVTKPQRNRRGCGSFLFLVFVCITCCKFCSLETIIEWSDLRSKFLIVSLSSSSFEVKTWREIWKVLLQLPQTNKLENKTSVAAAINAYAYTATTVRLRSSNKSRNNNTKQSESNPSRKHLTSFSSRAPQTQTQTQTQFVARMKWQTFFFSLHQFEQFFCSSICNLVLVVLGARFACQLLVLRCALRCMRALLKLMSSLVSFIFHFISFGKIKLHCNRLTKCVFVFAFAFVYHLHRDYRFRPAQLKWFLCIRRKFSQFVFSS